MPDACNSLATCRQDRPADLQAAMILPAALSCCACRRWRCSTLPARASRQARVVALANGLAGSLVRRFVRYRRPSVWHICNRILLQKLPLCQQHSSQPLPGPLPQQVFLIQPAAIAFCRTYFPWYNTEHRHAHPGRCPSPSNPERAGPARADPSSRLDPSSRTLRSRDPPTRCPPRSGLDQSTRNIHLRRNCSVNRNRQCLEAVDRFRMTVAPVGRGTIRRWLTRTWRVCGK